MKVRVSYVVIGRNEERHLARCLEAVRAQAGAAAAEIFYVDSASTDGSVTLASAVPGVTVLHLQDPAPNAAKGRNLGWSHCTGELVQFVDGDATLDPGWTEHAAQALADPGVAAVHGWLEEEHPERSVYNRLAQLDWPRGEGEVGAFGGIVMIRRSCLEETGGFPAAAQSGEEPLLALELRRRGHRLLQLPVRMAGHDIDLRDFGSYFRRCVMTGVSEAEQIAPRLALGDRPGSLRTAKNLIVVAAALFVLQAGVVWSTWVWAVAAAALGLDLARLTLKSRRRAGSSGTALAYALHVRFMAVPQVLGLVRWAMRRLAARHGGVLGPPSPLARS